MTKVPAAFKRADGSIEETTVEWHPMDMSPEAIAERKEIERKVKERESK